MRWILFTCSFLFVATTAASAQSHYEGPITFGVSGGYTHLYLPSPITLPINKDGAYADFDFAFRVPNIAFPLSVGAGATVSGFFRDERVLLQDDSGFFFHDHLNSDLGIYTLEARLGIPLHIGRSRGFFLNPRLGFGLVVDDYAIDHAESVTNGTLFFTDYHTGAAFGVRPSVEAGYYWPHWAVGVQAAYMAAWGDFGQLGNRAQDIQGGVFLRWN